MQKAIIYGTGKFWRENRGRLPKDIEIIAYADSDEKKATSYTGVKFEGKEILSPDEVTKRDFDLLFICTDFYFANRIFQNLKNYEMDLKKVRFLSRIVANSEWHYEIQPDKSIISIIDGIKVRERYLTDSDIMEEVFAADSYHMQLPEKDSVVIDIGMNIGIVSLYFARYKWVSKVYGFEPFSDTYQQAVDNFALNDVAIRSKMHPANIALSDKDEDMEVSVGHEESGWRNIMCHTEGKRHVRIRSRAACGEIERIINENVGKQIILKIDTEGSEFSIFESLKGTDILSKISAIMLEYHGEPKPIIDMLSASGFQYTVAGKERFGMIYAIQK